MCFCSRNLPPGKAQCLVIHAQVSVKCSHPHPQLFFCWLYQILWDWLKFPNLDGSHLSCMFIINISVHQSIPRFVSIVFHSLPYVSSFVSIVFHSLPYVSSFLSIFSICSMVLLPYVFPTWKSSPRFHTSRVSPQPRLRLHRGGGVHRAAEPLGARQQDGAALHQVQHAAEQLGNWWENGRKMVVLWENHRKTMGNEEMALNYLGWVKTIQNLLPYDWGNKHPEIQGIWGYLVCQGFDSQPSISLVGGLWNLWIIFPHFRILGIEEMASMDTNHIS